MQNQRRRSSLDFLNNKFNEDFFYIKNENFILNSNEKDNKSYNKYAEIISKDSSYVDENFFAKNVENNIKQITIKKSNHIEKFICDFDDLNEIDNYGKSNFKENHFKDFLHEKFDKEIELIEKQNFSIDESGSHFTYLTINQGNLFLFY